MESLWIYPAEESDLPRAEPLAKQLGGAVVRTLPPDGLTLRVSKDGLTLEGEGLKLRGDFTRMLPRLRPNNLNGELLIKAAKRKDFGETARALDATAGLGEDSFLLAAAGFQVTLYEYNPIIAALLADALERGSREEAIAPIISRMTLIPGDSREAMGQLDWQPDVILLDPMFPARQKSSLVTKKLQVIQKLELPCAEETALLNAALNLRPRKIIVKRPAKGAFLAEKKPSYSLSGKAVRYDCIVL